MSYDSKTFSVVVLESLDKTSLFNRAEVHVLWDVCSNEIEQLKVFISKQRHWFITMCTRRVRCQTSMCDVA